MALLDMRSPAQQCGGPRRSPGGVLNRGRCRFRRKVTPDRFMPPLRSRRRGRALPTLLAVLILVNPLRDAPVASELQKLQLEVFLNERPINLIGAFVLLPGKRIAASRKELEVIGLKPPGT